MTEQPYITKIKELLREKTGVDPDTLDYKPLPIGGKECYNTTLCKYHNIMTIKKSNQIVDKFLNLIVP